ncbi:cytosine permease [Kordiimonas pumila]|uniref:Cytosine permease n=1 Tax=Kordiimonas pumila TaxID=2161677 RepID=A0ABV7D7E3_9PROT|nr:cytosine permease [Kordiimonas pumila]
MAGKALMMLSETDTIEDYSVSTVPEEQTISGWRVAAIIIGINVGLATFLNGAQVGSALGLKDALFCAFLGGVILCIMGSLTAIASVRSRLSTYLLVQHSFGLKGAVVVNIMLAIIHLGWFGVNASFFGSAMVAAIRELYHIAGPFGVIVMAGSLLMAITTIFGFKAINKLALWAIPILLGIFITVFVMSIQKFGVVMTDPTPPVAMTFGVALSTIVGGNLLTVAAMPDLSRFITTNKQAVIGMLLSFPIATPLLVLLAAVPTMATDDVDIMNIITGFGLGLPALVILVFSTWTANSVNLYSYSLSLAATIRSIKPWVFTIVGALIGGIMAVVGIVESFVPFLLLLGVIIPPIAAIYVIDNFTVFGNGYDAKNLTEGPSVRWRSIVTWLVSAAVGLAGMYDVIALTTAPALDATLVAVVLHMILRKWSPQPDVTHIR